MNNKVNHKTRWLDRRTAKPGPYLCLCLSAEEMKQAAKGLTDYQMHFPKWGARAFLFPRDGTDELCAIVTLSEDSQKTNSAIEIAGMLVHEAVHVWQYYASGMGEDKPGDEQEAYAVQAISQELMAEYARRIA